MKIYASPLPELLFRAAETHRAAFDPTEIQPAALLSVKTGKCPEDCKYCAQSFRYDSNTEATPLMGADEVRKAAKAAKQAGAARFCMGAGWRGLKDVDVPRVAALIRVVKEEGLESCVTLGLANAAQLSELKEAGLDYYNHNIDTSPEHYANVITTRSFDDRLQTLAAIRDAGIKTCCGGIVGMGETRTDRASFLATLANLPEPPESVPINRLMPMKGTPLEHAEPLDDIELVRTVATARVLMPRSYVRLSAGRETMSETLQAMCFLAGANSIFYGETLLTAGNPSVDKDKAMLDKFGMRFGSGAQLSASAA
ncbi:MAG: biotin synthase BioB [Rickettsiales bacterium]